MISRAQHRTAYRGWGMISLGLVGWFGGWLISGCAGSVGEMRFHSGACDGSAGVAISATHFLAASDEDNWVRLYRVGRSGGPVNQWDLGAMMGVKGKMAEMDLEGAARAGRRVYWLGSHGRDSRGSERDERQVLVATESEGDGDSLRLVWIGTYGGLLGDIREDGRLGEWGVGSDRKKGEIDLEGMAALPDGRVWIGFRSPTVEKRAVVVTVENPDAAVRGLERARLGEVRRLDLGGLSIWDMVWTGDGILISAGPVKGQAPCRLYRWSGAGEEVELVGDLSWLGLEPEGLLTHDSWGPGRYLLLSDDGTVIMGGVECRDIKDASRRRFRSVWWEAVVGGLGVAE
jgi:hypothetical protein